MPVLAGLAPAESLARARTYLASRQYGLAIELFRAAGKDQALELDSLNGLAIAYDAIGRADLAQRYFEKALALRGDDPRTRRNLAAFYGASGQPQKKAALLADAAPQAPAEPPLVLADRSGESPLRDISFAPTDARDRIALDLRGASPLGGAFRPLIVKAAYAAPAVAEAGASASNTSIVCLADSEAPAGQGGGESVALFRINIGEVFVASQPAGSSCNIALLLPSGLKPETISNKEYLGFVAAYLDRLNHAYHMAELTMPTKLAAT
ncbi:hypothetical protein CDQ92_08120 [Sphingopyxis bauzanensis]|uniref:Uncharacterized protein n=1 Tax=Sphingopyxis bauzanensis TaxID=651663 RepID=A0A246JVM2_9SPHN|nr:hypothetical protein CDQ92_08120 [Sphingopyxis bauzanensis]